MPYETELTYNTRSSTLSIPVRLRERHLTPETRDAKVQAIGATLQVTIPSDRDTIAIRLPLREWETSDEQSRRITGANNGLIPLGTFEDNLDVKDGRIKAEVFELQTTL